MRYRYPGLLTDAPEGESIALPFNYHLKAELLESRLDELFSGSRRSDPIDNARRQFGIAATRIAEGAALSEALQDTLLSVLLMRHKPDCLDERQLSCRHDIAGLFSSLGIELAPLSQEEALFSWLPGRTPIRSLVPEQAEQLENLRRNARWRGTTRPHLPAAALQAFNGEPVHVGPQLLALAANVGSSNDVGIDGLCGELWLYQSVLSHGCVASHGNGAVKWIATTVLVPVIIACFPKEMSDPFREAWSRIQIKQKVSTLNGACLVSGEIELNYDSLIQEFVRSIHQGNRRATCMEQIALTLVGRAPGELDGQEGPNTRAARQTFKEQWGIADERPISHEYILALTRALQGIQPPSK